MRERALVAAGVIAGILSALWFSTVVAAMGKPSGSVYPDYEQQQRQAKDRVTHRWMRGLKDYPPAEAYQPNCSKDDKGYECFLLWRSARAAEVQARAAIAQAFWAQWSFWFLVATFAATAFAARYAYRAAVATHRGALADEASAVAANLTLKVMENTAQMQLRAYVSGGGAFIAVPMRDYMSGEVRPTLTDTFQVTVNNYGATPAHVTDVDIGFCNSNAVPPIPAYTENVLIGGVIPPGKEGARTAARFARAQITGDVIFGRFQYNDIFRAGVRRSGFILQITDDRDVLPIKAPAAYTDWD